MKLGMLVCLYTVDNKCASYITSASLPCMVCHKTPVDTHSNITVVTVMLTLSTFVILAADRTPPGWLTFLVCGQYSCHMAFCQPHGVVTTVVT